MESDIVSGQQSAWVLLKKLGEGDAGEVYLVESLLEKQIAILKRPGRSAFASDIIRQTAQITNESKILKCLSAYFDREPDLKVHVPRLIDQSKPGTAFSERLFIIIEKAPGIDLSLLARTGRMGLFSGAETEADTLEGKRFLQVLSENHTNHAFSDRILLQTLHSLLTVFDRIHAQPFDLDGLPISGILWNDVKPEHLYWNPFDASLTIIDWGNGQFLEQDGATKDRRFSDNEDFRQFIEAMGRFLEQSSPHLLARLDWPNRLSNAPLDPDILRGLRERITTALTQEIEGLGAARRRERELLKTGESGILPGKNPFIELEDLHRQIIAFGELPDFAGGLSFALSFAGRFARQELLEEVQEICTWAEGLPGANAESLRLTTNLARMASRSPDERLRQAFSQAVQATLCSDWGAALWSLSSVFTGPQEPDWWFDLVAALRRLGLGEAVGSIHPQLIARRTLLTLQAMLERIQDQPIPDPHTLVRLQDLVRRLREEIIPAWLQFDPSPPYSALVYADVEEVLPEISAFLPEAGYNLDQALDLPRVLVRRVLDDWDVGDFPAVSAGLRQMLLADPDRKRVLRTARAVQETPAWLEKVHAGPQEDEHYRSFVTDIEFEGRELRNLIGPASWLDLILDGCRQLRKGVWPPDLFTTLPMLINEMPWLARFERRERLPAHVRVASPTGPQQNPAATVIGVIKGRMGAEQDLHLLAPLDAWIAEARGSSARVFSGIIKDAQKQADIPAAIKLMRMDKTDYALPLFKEEVIVLNAMSDVPGVTPLLECGFIKLEGDGRIPTEREATVDPTLAGELIRIGPRSGQEFIYQIENRIADDWIPYLAIEQRDSKDNLLALCDAGMTRGTYRPVADLLLICIQICDILSEAHRRNIVYRDHKILHYYWLEDIRGVFSIDWNVARLHPEGLSDYEKQMDLVQFGARALHHILTGRTAPGALPLGPTRPDEIEQAAQSYQAQWTYDDQRLPEDLRAILEKALAAEYTDVNDLRGDLQQCFLNH